MRAPTTISTAIASAASAPTAKANRRVHDDELALLDAVLKSPGDDNKVEGREDENRYQDNQLEGE
ncbi:MAG: hypothetical protein M3451_10620 [Chloroflexota bacterium]|nr:hypothetical protein [Chloroflexota bacterium]